MKTRTLGRTGLKVSEIGFGAWAIGGNAHGNSYGPTDDTESVAAVHRAIEMGVNFFDTADVYGWATAKRSSGRPFEAVATTCTSRPRWAGISTTEASG